MCVAPQICVGAHQAFPAEEQVAELARAFEATGRVRERHDFRIGGIGGLDEKKRAGERNPSASNITTFQAAEQVREPQAVEVEAKRGLHKFCNEKKHAGGDRNASSSALTTRRLSTEARENGIERDKKQTSVSAVRRVLTSTSAPSAAPVTVAPYVCWAVSRTWQCGHCRCVLVSV